MENVGLMVLLGFAAPHFISQRNFFVVDFETVVISLYISFTKQELLTGLGYTYRDQLNISV